MSKRESITRYSLIIKRLRKSAATFDEISDYLAYQSELEEYKFTISKRTFQRDLNDIREVYKVDILFDKSQKRYYIDSEDKPEINDRILEAFDVYNALNISERLSNRIHFGRREPHGAHHLYDALNGIQKHVRLRFLYRSFTEDENTLRLVEPYALKEFKGRWYLIGKDTDDQAVKSFGLDRMDDLELTRQKYEYPADFDIDRYYAHCYGIMSANSEKPYTVHLWFNQLQGRYIKSLPLHTSQKILSDSAKGLLVELTLFLTYDFIMELLSMGGNVKVIQPRELIDQVKKAHKEGFTLYQ